jgi:hypothetical protein
VSENKQNGSESSGDSAVMRPRNNVAAMSETLRNGAAAGADAPARGDDRLPLFWRVFGGTLLSIAALVVVTVYQQFSNSLFELRNDMIHLNEARADLLKKDDFNTRLTSVWNSIKDLQTAQATVTGLRERAALLEQHLKDAETDRKEMTHKMDQLRDRIAVLEGQLKSKHAAGD